MNPSFWLQEAEGALLRALHAVRCAQQDAVGPVAADGIRGDLRSSFAELDHCIGVANSATKAAMRAEVIAMGAQR